MKLLFKIMKKIMIGSFLLYLYNYFAISYDLAIPINAYSLSIVSFLDVFGLVGMVIYKIMIL